MASSGDRMKRDTLLGLVFFGGLGLLLWATLNLTDLSFGKGKRLHVYFPNGIGLQVGDPVMLLGTRVGKVEEVNVDLKAPTAPSHAVRVTMSLAEGAPLTRTATFEIQDSTLLGGKQVEIDPGRDEGALDESVPLKGMSTGNPLASVGDTFSDPDNKTNLGGLLRAGREFLENLNSERGTFGRLVVQDELYEELLATVRSLRQSAEAIEQAQGALGRVVHDTQMGEDLAQLLANLRSVSDKLDTGDGLAAKLLNDEAMAADVADTLQDLRTMVAQIRAGEGALGALVADPQLAADLKAAVAQVRRLADMAGDPKAGLVGALLADPALSDQIRVIVGDVAVFTNNLAQGHGLLGKLMNDEDLAEQFSRVLRQVARAIEDAREAAPIGTFVQVLAGGL